MLPQRPLVILLVHVAFLSQFYASLLSLVYVYSIIPSSFFSALITNDLSILCSRTVVRSGHPKRSGLFFLRKADKRHL